MAAEGFWSNQEAANKTIEEFKALKARVEPFNEVIHKYKDISELIDIIDESDEAAIKELEAEVSKIDSKIKSLEFSKLLGEENDKNNAILSINSGAGGTESCDWAKMLLRMYGRWAEAKGFKTQVVDTLPGEEAGIKNATMIIKGSFAFGYLRSETGVHRLVRISPFDSNKRRHTSFASVDVIPEIEDNVDIEIKQEDLKVNVYRSSGPGGQSVNTTDSAVRITHIPTGIIVQCQNERSQLQNKQTAMKILRAKLYEIKMEEKKKQQEALHGAKQEIAWGSQIRSYVFHPYTMVKDHRTNYETGKAIQVMDGELDLFIEEYLKWKAKG